MALWSGSEEDGLEKHLQTVDMGWPGGKKGKLDASTTRR